MKRILLIAFCISSFCAEAQYLYVPGGYTNIGTMGAVKIYPSGDAGPTGRPRKLEFTASGSATVIQANSDNNFIEHDVIINAEGTALNSNQLVIYRNGNVGVGTVPAFPFHIRGGNPNSNQMTLGATGTGTFAVTSYDGGAYGLFAGVSGTGRAWLQAGRYDSNLAYDMILQGAGGNVGIGNSAPSYALDIQTATDNFSQLRLKSPGSPLVKFSGSYNSGNGAEVFQDATGYLGFNLNSAVRGMTLTQNGNLGIGTNTPQFKLQVPSNNQVAAGFSYVDNPIDPDNNYVRTNFGSNVYWDAGANLWRVSAIGANDFSSIIHPNGGGFAFMTAPSDANGDKTLTNTQFSAYERMRITADGNVGIGTTYIDAKLTVKGDIHTREVRVDVTNGTGPDYVFEKDYNLLPLAEVESYIKENKHLPEVPSAKEMEKDGLNLKEMNLLLLKKVEELTLHVIELNKVMMEQRKINEKQQAINEELLREIGSMKKNHSGK